ncbi:cytochrome-c peroxidase [Thiothrix nivea]|uniref:Di-heme cytochrome c peroxidase n=1 Tax=Thiothrix nivea (strain ATCC 35100 / DSM 5205 / JP2) TaxID=870187 RepID=A0A656HIY1_THINJ|nr:cytochrome-c peroxidase [Thiothrix nivea]EIJ36333.1 Di-heme cytochrome c peroxidase [Thiothrix nivea DSM 5205]
MKTQILMVSLLTLGLGSAVWAEDAAKTELAKIEESATAAKDADKPADVVAAKDEPIKPIEAAEVKDPAMVELGKKLYFDPRLSKSGFISCNSCHNLSMGGTDNLPTSIGDHWQQGPINAPTVLNSSMNVAQFWDGRAKDLKEQAGGPIANPGEMAFTHELALDVLQSIPQYKDEFKSVFGKDEMDIGMVTDAIAAFEETLVTPDSKFDQWLKGDSKALADNELAGYKLFKESGCVACHNGPAVGGNSFQKMGVVEPYKTDSKAEGMAGLTKKDEDRFKFKVPTLRNVEMTYPYFHDGAAKTLEQAVTTMGQLQLGKKFTDAETADIVAFLKTLTGKQPELQLPILPPSTNDTPVPEPFNKADMEKAKQKDAAAKTDGKQS